MHNWKVFQWLNAMEIEIKKNLIQGNIKSILLAVMAINQFSKPFKTYLGKEAAYKFTNNMIEESK